MEFTIQKENLIAAMEKSIRAIPSKTTNPILYNFLIRVNGMDGEVISNSGMSTGIKTKFTAMSVEDGECLIDAKTLLQAVKKLGKGDVTIKTDGDVAIVTSKKARFEFATLPVDDYPQLYKVEDAVTITVNGTILADMIDGVAFAVNQNVTDKKQQGIGFKIENNNLSLTATNMIEVANKNKGIEADAVDVIIPGQPMSDLARLVGDEDVTIEIAKVYARFTTSDMEMTLRLTDGQFFNMKQVFESASKLSVKMDRKELMECVDRALVVKTQDKTPIIMSFEPGKVNLQMKTANKSFDEDVECDLSEGLIKIGVNPQYLLDILKAIQDDEITLGLDTPKTPIKLFADNGEYKYILLPVSI